jgi:hypothetical protein
MTCRDGSVLAGAWVSDAFESELDSYLTSQVVEAAIGEADKAKSTANAARQVLRRMHQRAPTLHVFTGCHRRVQQIRWA